ncbi:TetR family transcriptional regulator [Sphingomonas histidinilytica]|uniref:Transcriptional regulator, TetR family n=1 Tax=Rhizorhabdus histidinilytica TaxID=439228 RepID=A0A1T5D945_9SPHN|nr:TetR/AcrR family transcriptional regulator [Rhizorhabdus histidinilytica]MBO9376990.1 TetR family transcriptional regulator [Rhizorhabdus histidinilytica]SKB68131.1 transcriptional regulator, TetR family [Rhizorhabdus histidinilytica]
MITTAKSRPPARKATQARGRARRVELLEAARAMLGTQNLHQIGMIAVAETAGIPASSAYHFFPEIGDLWKELARILAAAQAELDQRIPHSEEWETVVERSLECHQRAFNADRAARQLMLGPHTPPEIKHAGCKENFRFGTALWQAMRRQFLLPGLADSRELFFKALLIADVFFSLSVAEQDRVSDEALAEAKLATIAYLRAYLPTRLARIEEGGEIPPVPATEAWGALSPAEQG